VKINTQLLPRKKSSPIICDISVIFTKKLPKVNSRPMGENSPYLVTLLPNLGCNNNSNCCLLGLETTSQKRKEALFFIFTFLWLMTKCTRGSVL
jgi:hypothetical protein